MNNKGFSLIELVMFIIIGAIFLPASVIAFTKVMDNYSRPDYYVKAKFYADKKTAEAINNIYNSIGCLNETVDGYILECTISMIDPETLTTAGSNANYKQIKITVQHPNLLENYEIYTIVTKRPKDSS